MRLLFRLFFSLSVFLILLVAIYASGFVSGAWVYNERQSGINIPALSRILASLPLPDAESTFFAPASAPPPLLPPPSPRPLREERRTGGPLSSEHSPQGGAAIRAQLLRRFGASGRIPGGLRGAHRGPSPTTLLTLSPVQFTWMISPPPLCGWRGSPMASRSGPILRTARSISATSSLARTSLPCASWMRRAGKFSAASFAPIPCPRRVRREALVSCAWRCRVGRRLRSAGKSCSCFISRKTGRALWRKKGRFIAVDASGRLRMALEGGFNDYARGEIL